MFVGMDVNVYVKRFLWLVIYRIPPADDSTHVNKWREVCSGVSLRGSHSQCLPPFSFNKGPSAEGVGVHGLGERAT